MPIPICPIDGGAWHPLPPQSFVDRRVRLTRDGQLVRQHVRAMRAVIVRRGEDGKAEYDRCPHAHIKGSAARKCAEREANRRNRAKETN